MIMLGSATQPQAAFLRSIAARCFHTACMMPNDQRKRCRIRPFARRGRFGEGERAVFVVHLVAGLQQAPW